MNSRHTIKVDSAKLMIIVLFLMKNNKQNIRLKFPNKKKEVAINWWK